MFAVPVHATTHALGAGSSDDYADGNSPDHGLRGRPAPTTQRSSDDVLLQAARERPKRVQAIRPRTSPAPLLPNDLIPAIMSETYVDAVPINNSIHTSYPTIDAGDVNAAPPDYVNPNQAFGDLPERESVNAGEGTSAGGGRFPRWRGWLEKRALERHFEHLDAGTASGDTSVARKKSWGAAVNDEGAISDDEEQEGDEATSPPNRQSLHVHGFGSRFLSHLPVVPLCSAFLDIPPAPSQSRTGQRLLRRSVPEGIKRRVLLIGTADGLYVAECRRRRRQESLRWSDGLKWRSKTEGKMRGADKDEGWNDTIRCKQVWHGVGLYQMSLLSSKAVAHEGSGFRMSRYGFSFLSAPPRDVGILLALCSTAKSKAPIGYVNPQGSTVSYNTVASSSGGFSKEAPPPSLSTTYFGNGAGGGPSKVVPPGGTGVVRMWSVEVLRKLVAHTLDVPHARPFDLQQNSKRDVAHGPKKGKLADRLRRAWASLGDPPSERKARRASRQAGSSGLALERADTRLTVDEDRTLPSHASEPILGSSDQIRCDSRMSMGSDLLMDQVPSSPVESGELEELLLLAQSAVTIKLPAGQPHTNVGQSESLTSLFSDESSGTHGGSTHPYGSGSTSVAASKGVLFFSVFEANTDAEGKGTWYLAIATAKSIYLYEAVHRPDSDIDASRSWVFVKEFYVPFPPRAIAFVFSEAPQRAEVKPKAVSVRKQPQHSVKSSAYSSVFRSHADLTLFVSFGKKAVFIRASDASVKEAEIRDAEKPSASELGHHKIPPQSLTSNAGKRRSLSADLLVIDSASSKERWAGIESVFAQVNIRATHHSLVEAMVPPYEGLVSRFVGEDDDDDDPDYNSASPGGYDGRGVTLHDSPLQSQVPTTVRQTVPRGITAATLPSTESAHLLTAKLAVLTKGSTSHVFPLPVPWDLPRHRPLGQLQWTEVPSAVTAWAQVVGLERHLSSGPVSVSALRYADEGKKARTERSVTLHVKVTVLAFLSSRLEMRNKRVKVRVTVPFAFNKDSELELEPIAKEDVGNGTLGGGGEESEVGMAGEEEDGEEDILTKGETSAHQELEYLCGMLSSTPKGHEVAKPWEAGGDAGAWGFDWRGANDFRLFFTSVHV